MSELTIETAVNLRAQLGGVDRPFRLIPAVSKGGNVYYTLPKSGPYGVAITAQAPALPTSVTVVNPETGETSATVSLVKGLTNDGRPKVSGQARVTLPTADGVERLLSATVSLRKDGTWNCKVSAIGIGGGGGTTVRDIDVFDDAQHPGNPQIS